MGPTCSTEMRSGPLGGRGKEEGSGAGTPDTVAPCCPWFEPGTTRFQPGGFWSVSPELGGDLEHKEKLLRLSLGLGFPINLKETPW